MACAPSRNKECDEERKRWAVNSLSRVFFLFFFLHIVGQKGCLLHYGKQVSTVAVCCKAALWGVNTPSCESEYLILLGERERQPPVCRTEYIFYIADMIFCDRKESKISSERPVFLPSSKNNDLAQVHGRLKIFIYICILGSRLDINMFVNPCSQSCR